MAPVLFADLEDCVGAGRVVMVLLFAIRPLLFTHLQQFHGLFEAVDCDELSPKDLVVCDFEVDRARVKQIIDLLIVDFEITDAEVTL